MKFLIVLFAFCAISVNCFDNTVPLAKCQAFLDKAKNYVQKMTVVGEKAFVTHYNIFIAEWNTVQEQLHELNLESNLTCSKDFSMTKSTLQMANMMCTMKISEITPPVNNIQLDIMKVQTNICSKEDCTKQMDDILAEGDVRLEEAYKSESNMEACFAVALATFKSTIATQLEDVKKCISA